MSNQPELIIHVSSHMDGYGFRLYPKSRKWLEQHHPIGETVSSVFIGFDQMRGVESIPPQMWDQVCHLLTGYSLEEINQLGGFQALYLPNKKVIMNSQEIHV